MIGKRKIVPCVSCEKESLTKNEIGINKKILGGNTQLHYCPECLAKVLGVTTQDILDQIEVFRLSGCKLFE
jgi:hypothetical protein